MSPSRFAECLDRLHLSVYALAELCRTNPKQIRRWVQGNAIPAELAAWLEARMIQTHKLPPPDLSNRPRGRHSHAA